MKQLINSRYILLVLALLFYACESKQTKKEEPKENMVAETITLSQQQALSIGLQVGDIITKNLNSTLKVNGKLELPPQNQADVSLPVGGIVKSILVTEGSAVSQGDILALIQSTEFIQLQQDYLQSKAQLDYLKEEFERQKSLQDDNINSKKTFQKAKSDFESEKVISNSIRQKLLLYNINADKLTIESIANSFPVIAPISGNVNDIAIKIGTFAEPNRRLFNLVDNRYLHIDLTIFEKDISLVQVGQSISFTDANHSNILHTAKIFSINKSFEENQQAVIAHAKILDANETLLPGMFIEARINLNNNVTRTVPDNAIVSNGNDHYIFIQERPYFFKQVQVRVGTSDMGFTEIFPFAEISNNQKIVVRGAYNLLSEITKGASEHEE